MIIKLYLPDSPEWVFSECYDRLLYSRLPLEVYVGGVLKLARVER